MKHLLGNINFWTSLRKYKLHKLGQNKIFIDYQHICYTQTIDLALGSIPVYFSSQSFSSNLLNSLKPAKYSY